MVKHDTLLICSLSKEHRENLREIFSGTFHLLEASSVNQMLLLLRQNLDCIASLVLDITNIDQADVVSLRLNENTDRLSRVPIIILSENDSSDILNQAFNLGASDVIPMDYDPHAMLKRVDNIVELHLHKQNLEAMVEEQKSLLRHTSDAMVDTLSSIIEQRSAESGLHILRIRHFTKIILEEVARCCPEYELTDHIIAIICSASALHDIGKIAIPDAILMKPGSLTDEEREIMKTHTTTGFHILETLVDMADKEYLRYAHNICHYHHERWDGNGYPEGLRGDAIPICAQVVGLADVFDALTSKRVYKDAYSVSQAVNMIIRGECGVFSPKLLECFKNIALKLAALAQDYADGASPKNEVFDTSLAQPNEQPAEDSIERIRGKYYALVHYVNGLLIELDLDHQLFHLIYNPYPELASMQDMNTLEDIHTLIFQRLIHPTHHEKMVQFIDKELPSFLNEGLRRAQYHFRINGLTPEGDLLEVNLLRINPMDPSRRTLAVLAKKISPAAVNTEINSNLLPIEYTLSCRNDQHFTLLDIGDHETRLAGYSFQEIHQRFNGQLLDLVHPDDREMVRREFTEQLRHGTDVKLEYRLLHKDGTTHWFYNISRLQTEGTALETLHSFLLDINSLHRESDMLQEKMQRYEIILAQTENVLFEWEVGSNTISFSDTWEKIFGYPPIQWTFKSLQEGSVFHPDDVPRFIDRINALDKGSDYEVAEIRIATAKGRYIWCRFRATAVRDSRGQMQKICGIIINIDTEKRAEQILQNRADQDSLTRLLNKDAARKQAEEYFARYPDGVNSALLIIDLDDFKQINDRYGHLFGDTVLVQIAKEIKKMFRGQDIVARIGGDEFMVVMRGISDKTLLEQRCQQLLQTLQNVFQNTRYKLPLSCSIGIALSPLHGQTYFELYQHADQALYSAKANGKNHFEIYDAKADSYLNHLAHAAESRKPIDSDADFGVANDSIVRYAFQKLYSSQDLKRSINEVLCSVGKKTNVSRVYIFENDDENRYCFNTYEWCNQGIHSEIDNLQNISYETDIPGYTENFDENGIFYCPDVTILPKPVYDILAPQGIKSMLQCAIRENGVFRGYIGFDECLEQRLWTQDQIDLLNFLSEVLSMFLLQLRHQKQAQQQTDSLKSILDNQEDRTYIVHPETYQLQYANQKLMQQQPEIHPGMLCHQALHGLSSPCPGCPLTQLGNSTNYRHLAYRQDIGSHVLVEAARIRWSGSDACLVTEKALSGIEVSDMPKKVADISESETANEIRL